MKIISKSLSAFWGWRVFNIKQTMTDSRQLLDDFARYKSEAAFRELVTRYLNLVYSCALRRVDGDAHRAEDVAQVVFADLARKADELSSEVMLGGWLHRHTCFVAANMMRGERRRLAREREAVEMNLLHEDDTHLDFALLAPLLDETINQLEDADRTAILLRFFEQKDFCSVGQSLGSSEEASRKRVSRALDKMRDLLARHGISTTAAALSVAVSTNAVQAAPAGMAAKISATILSGTAATTATIITATKTIAITTLQKIAVTAALTATVGVGIYESSQAHGARIEASKLQAELASFSGQLQQLQKEREQGTNEVAELRAENSRLKANSNQQELLKLRGEVARLKNSLNDLPGDITKQWLDKINGYPIISVDTKKKELVGQFKNNGRVWSRDAILVQDHDFRSQAKGMAIPYGIYDLHANRGTVVVGTSHDTPAFAVEAICQ